MTHRWLLGCAAWALFAGGCGSSSATEGETPSYPEGCEYLAEPGMAECMRDDARCETARTGDAEYDFWLELDDTADSFSDGELEQRQDCVARWLEDMGLEPEKRSTDTVIVRASWEQVA